MSFVETIRRARELLEREGRISVRVLKLEFDLDDARLEFLIEELVDVQQVAAREGNVLSWIGTASTDIAMPERQAGTTHEAASEPVAAERRQLTVLFCDLVESTALAARLDPEDWREVVRHYQEAAAGAVERFGGHVAQYLGDGLLVYFGYPAAHEDDAERSVRAGLGIVAALRELNAHLEVEHGLRLAVRVGIHTGPVVVGEIGRGRSRETLAVGDTTNVAARLQGIAEPDTVLLSAATLRLVQGIFVTEDSGVRDLKGVGEVRTYRAVQPSGMRSRLDVSAATGLTPFVGREQEMMLLEDRWAQVQEGRGQAVLICGEAGIGKSRLVQAVRERLAERAHTWLECRASAYTQDSALYPVLELHRQSLGFRAETVPETKLERIEAGLQAARFDLTRAMPLMAAFHALLPPDRYEARMLSPEAQRQKTLELLCEWLLRLGQQQPVVLLIEDLHWIDPSTLELLGAVLEQIARAQVLLLLTYRPDFELPWGAHSHITPMLLSRLTSSQLGDLIRKAAAGRDLPEPWVEEIIRRSDGVPLFAEELTKAVLESNPEPPASGDEAPELHIPETLQDSLMARLDALGPVKELAQLGAVLGREFSYDLLLRVSPMKEEPLQQALAEAVREELFYQRGTPPEATYLFKHALTRDAAYQSLLRSTRQRHHHRVAETLVDRMAEVVESQPELVAHHLTEAGDAERAIAYWQRAGERAAQRMENAEAIRHLRKGLELLVQIPAGGPRDERELGLQIAIGGPLGALRGYASPEVEQAYGRARQLCQAIGEAPQLYQALFGLAAVHYYTRGQLPTASELGRQLLGLAQRSGEASHLMLGHLAVGLPLFDQGEMSEALEHLEEAIQLYEPSRDQALMASYGFDLDVISRSIATRALWQLGHPEQALALCRETIERAQESLHAHSLAHAAGYAAILHHARRERSQTREWAEKAVAIAAEQRLAVWLGAGRVLRGWALSDGGSPEGIDEIQQGLGQLAPTGFQLGAPLFLGLLAEAQSSLGHRDDALGALDTALGIAQANDNRFWDSELLRLKGELLLEDDARAEEGEGYLRKSLELATAKGWRSLELRAATSLARLWQRQGKTAEAHDLLHPVYDWFTEGFDTQDLKDANVLLEELL